MLNSFLSFFAPKQVFHVIDEHADGDDGGAPDIHVVVVKTTFGSFRSEPPLTSKGVDVSHDEVVAGENVKVVEVSSKSCRNNALQEISFRLAVRRISVEKLFHGEEKINCADGQMRWESDLVPPRW